MYKPTKNKNETTKSKHVKTDITTATLEEDASVLSDLTGNVDKVIMYQQRDGERAVKMKIRSQRIPTIGDKFSSRHGQKGTIGMTFGSENLPWNMDGIVPDIIVNPHALPSRMTIDHVFSLLLHTCSLDACMCAFA